MNIGLRIFLIVLLALVLVASALVFGVFLLFGALQHPNNEAMGWVFGLVAAAFASLWGIIALGMGIRRSVEAQMPAAARPADPTAAQRFNEYLRYALIVELALAVLGFTYRIMSGFAGAGMRSSQSIAVPIVFLVLYQGVYVYGLIANAQEPNRIATTVLLAFASCAVAVSLWNLARFPRFLYFQRQPYLMQYLGAIVTDAAVAVFAFRVRRALATGPEYASELLGSYVCAGAYLIFLEAFAGRILQILSLH